MKIKSKKIKTLLQDYKNISLLNKTNAVLGWDMNVNLPQKGTEIRTMQTALLTSLVVEKWHDAKFRRLVEDIDFKELNIEEKGILRNLQQAAKFYYKVPKDIIVEFEETTSRAFMSWQKAKAENKFKDFLPHLKKIVRLSRIVADNIGYKENPYDALLDLYEPGLTTTTCKKMFGVLQPELTNILNKIKKTRAYQDKSDYLSGEMYYPIDDQKQLASFVLRRMNYDFDAGRMDISSHPFSTSLGSHDVRITNRYKVDDFRESLMVAMHEGGHALYEQGINEELSLTPLGGGVSLGIHESQSRFWENQIGRSYEFLSFITPTLHAFYPEQLSKAGPETIFSLFNMVRPSLIRTEADEVTYNLHVALRFELEEAMINGKVKLEDLPEIWKTKMKKYLGVAPLDDREGVLQDVHWSYGSFGYFPTYTLGNLYGAQFTNAMKKELDINELMARGELGTILSWLRANIHRHGSLYWPDELVKRVTGEALNTKYFLSYINKKFKSLYQFK